MKHYGLGLALPMFGLALAGTLGKRWRRLILVGLAILGLLFLMSCGGVSKSSNNPGSPTPSPNPSPTPSPGGTPSGSYTVTINASGGNVQHSTIFTLNVQ